MEIRLEFQEGRAAVCAGERRWESAEGRLVTESGKVLAFSQAREISHTPWKTGVGAGLRSRYAGFDETGFTFETIVWREDATGNVFFEWIPLEEDGLALQAVEWPGAMASGARPGGYTLYNDRQGMLLPDDWSEAVQTRDLTFGGQLCSAGAYMPWFAQVSGGGYLAVCETPWDAAYWMDHPAGGPGTKIGFRLLPSLGRMAYARRMRYTFRDDCDYNSLCKLYRASVSQAGKLVTLAEKAARNPNVERLIGAPVVHKGIKTHISPASAYYDKEHPEQNDFVVPFEKRRQELTRYREKGVEKLYLHLDGWGEPGYDNQHPDYLPACGEAGGWEGLRRLSETAEECGYLFGVHDQYRDYYYDAKTFDPEFACRRPDGSVFEETRWAGGRQTLLCATQAPAYVRRNFGELLARGVKLQATYLDVFTCNEPDECANPLHRMTRRECLDYRAACFGHLTSLGIAPSSEEAADWAVGSLVFCHYAPYGFQLAKEGAPKLGVPVPLWSLVYHDCMIVPWLMRRTGEGDEMLHALLCGGTPYLEMGDEPEETMDERIRRAQVVARLHERVARCELVRHEFLGGDRQRTVFSDGTRVTVDFTKQEYEIEWGE